MDYVLFDTRNKTSQEAKTFYTNKKGVEKVIIYSYKDGKLVGKHSRTLKNWVAIHEAPESEYIKHVVDNQAFLTVTYAF